MAAMEEEGREPGGGQREHRHEDEAVREVAVPAEGHERVVGGADEDVEVGGFGGEQGGDGGGGDRAAAAMDGDAGGDAEGGVRDVVHGPNLWASVREGRRTFVF